MTEEDNNGDSISRQDDLNFLVCGKTPGVMVDDFAKEGAFHLPMTMAYVLEDLMCSEELDYDNLHGIDIGDEFLLTLRRI